MVAAVANCLACDELRPLRPASPFPMVASQTAQESVTDWQSKGFPMYQMLCVLLATVAYGTATGHCQDSQAGITTVTFQSSTYSDMRQLLTHEAATGTVTLKANLGFPEQARDRYPAVIVVHGLGGYRDSHEGYVPAELGKVVFATWTIANFARGVSP